MASSRTRKLFLVGGALTAAGVAAALAARRRSSFHEGSPWPELPEGRPTLVITADGAELAISVAGPDDGPTVVLAHCWTGLRTFWAEVAGRLVDEGHRVVVYDQRGHGASTLGDTEPSIPNLGDDLRLVLESVDARDATLVGHSMGGMTIQSYAIEHPDDFQARISGVVLVATAAQTLGRALPPDFVARFLGDGRSEWLRRGRVGRSMVRGAIGERPQRTHINLTLEGFATAAGPARAGFLVAMAAMDLRPAGPVIGTVPTRVLVGTRDTLTPVRVGRLLAAGIPGAELEVIPGAGHMLPLEAPDRIVDAIRTVAAQPDRVSAS